LGTKFVRLQELSSHVKLAHFPPLGGLLSLFFFIPCETHAPIYACFQTLRSPVRRSRPSVGLCSCGFLVLLGKPFVVGPWFRIFGVCDDFGISQASSFFFSWPSLFPGTQEKVWFSGDRCHNSVFPPHRIPIVLRFVVLPYVFLPVMLASSPPLCCVSPRPVLFPPEKKSCLFDFPSRPLTFWHSLLFFSPSFVVLSSLISCTKVLGRPVFFVFSLFGFSSVKHFRSFLPHTVLP